MPSFKTLLAAAVTGGLATAAPSSRLFPKRQSNSSELLVDLGYSVYNGTANTTNGINTWYG